MFKILTVEDRVEVPPRHLELNAKEAVKKTLSENLVGEIKRNLGIVLSILEVSEVGEGEIEPENPNVIFQAKYKAMVLMPELHEITIGEVVDITEFGVFVSIGPIDALCHVSQVMDDYVTFDEKQKKLFGKESKRTLEVGDFVIARVIAVSLDKREINKINLTMRQPGLGALKWFEEEIEKEAKAVVKKTEEKK
jgi:DNA-directed RNA polymerase subunit E'